MLLNCGVGEDSWESLDCKEIQTVHLKGNQSWILIGRTDAEAETPILWPPKKTLMPGNRRWEEKGTTEDEMVGWHHWLNGHEFDQALEVGDGQGSLACFSPWGHKESDITERLNQTDRFWVRIWCQLWQQQQAFWSSSGIVARSASVGIAEQWAGGSLGHHPSFWPPKFQLHLVDRNRTFFLVCCMLLCLLSCFSCAQLCSPMDSSPPSFSVRGILQARILEWVAMPSSRGIFPTWGLNPGLSHCGQILYHLSHQGNPKMKYSSRNGWTLVLGISFIGKRSLYH